MPTITQQGDSVGKARRVPVSLLGGGRGAKMGLYQVTFDTSYPTGGESISSIWDDFSEVLGIFVQAADITIADNRFFAPDLTNKKLIMFTAVNTEAGSASDQSAVTGVQLLVIGY